MYNKESIVSIFIERFPEFEQKLLEHLEFNFGKLLPYVFLEMMLTRV